MEAFWRRLMPRLILWAIIYIAAVLAWPFIKKKSPANITPPTPPSSIPGATER